MSAIVGILCIFAVLALQILWEGSGPRRSPEIPPRFRGWRPGPERVWRYPGVSRETLAVFRLQDMRREALEPEFVRFDETLHSPGECDGRALGLRDHRFGPGVGRALGLFPPDPPEY